MHTRNESVGYPLVVYPEDKARIHFDGRSGKPNLADIASVVGAKALHIALVYYHDVRPDDLPRERKRVKFTKAPLLQTISGENGGMFIRIAYRFINRPKREYYVHTFQFVRTGDGLDGRLFTHMRKHVPH
jgi:hypothetical protein